MMQTTFFLIVVIALSGRAVSQSSFRCPTGRYIPWRYVCNGRWDCSDGSDERNCPTTYRPEHTTETNGATTYDPCYRNPCQNGGTCYPKRTSYWPYQYTEYSCQCNSYHYGQKCQYYGRQTTERPTVETTQSCQNGGYYDYYNGRCRCQAGTWGYYCQYGSVQTTVETTKMATTYDPCYRNPCQNGGTCYPKRASYWPYQYTDYSCQCDSYHYGQKCQYYGRQTTERPTVETTQSCQNGGYYDYYNGRCRCQAGTWGYYCQYGSVQTTVETTKMATTYDPCYRNPCQNGGTCYPKRASYWPYQYTEYSCQCDSYHYGQKCQYYGRQTTERPTVETTQSCQNGGYYDYYNGRCRCQAGTWGYYCQYGSVQTTVETTKMATTYDPCYRNPCQNGGTCYPKRASHWPYQYTEYSCQCDSYHYGQKCQYYGRQTTERPTVETTQSCQNGGYYDYYNGRCRCQAGTWGYYCQYGSVQTTVETTKMATTYDPCYRNPCQNGGTCYPKRASYWPYQYTEYSCQCDSYHYGQKCQYYGRPTTERPTEMATQNVAVKQARGAIIANMAVAVKMEDTMIIITVDVAAKQARGAIIANMEVCKLRWRRQKWRQRTIPATAIRVRTVERVTRREPRTGRTNTQNTAVSVTLTTMDRNASIMDDQPLRDPRKWQHRVSFKEKGSFS
ncbi:neurogenic locus notch homolog protein 2-like [Lingula anatina]|uniref:Neurogenic locus notch homolog protein 2-like n=1 Tax=Lingula anatina TaxID=7574 RepID=A0A1S3HPU0_LINAN|nr:neurogenic locus notch homolog protein 2-like [Lingula anatina]|eukprot:XP_013388050.1 neurogenic locus notch homolog protein 2-like [Lingula anatina]